MGGQGSEINEGKMVDAKAFDLLVYRISQLSCNGFAENYRAKNYNRPPKEEGRNRGNLSSLHEARILRENFARREEICILGSSSRFPYEFRINNSIRAKKSFLTTLPSDRFLRKKFSLSFENKLLSPF